MARASSPCASPPRATEVAGSAGAPVLPDAHRINPTNGIALSALHDRAFDRGLITLDEDLRVVLSPRLRTADPTDIHRTALLDIEGRPIRLPSRFEPDAEALAWHRERVFLG